MKRWRSFQWALWGVSLGFMQAGCSPGIAITLPDVDASLPPACTVLSDTDCDEGLELDCVDLQADEANCGECGRVCGGADVCAGGQCCAGTVCGAVCLADEFVVERRTGPSECVGALLYDLDADGFDDAVYPCQLGESIELYWGNVAGTLGTPLSLASGRVSPHMAFGDVDEDGHRDILVALQGEGPPFTDRIRIFFGGAMRTFPRQSDIMFDGNPRAMVLTDLDADGHLDLLMDRPGAADACMVLLPGNGRGLFDTVDPLCVWSIPASPDDGANIVVVARDPGVTHFARVVSEAVWLLDITDAGVVVSAARQVVPGVERAAHLTVLEADGDESPDLIVASVPMATSGPVVIQRSTTPAASCDYDSGFAPNADGLALWITSAGDFNGDGLIDLVGRAACCEQPTSTLDLYIRRWLDPPFD
ncbi:MAG: VCBS repeat-containing protein [Sandaracinaceae bacterium]|nr:VCBS repeat-containing protein [Sandaracinaceae bacterium]